MSDQRGFQAKYRSSTPMTENRQPQNGEHNVYERLFRGPQAAVRVHALKQGLSKALEAWWHSGQMPVSGLLRDGLLALEAGHDLDEAERTLLLRAALYYGRGMRTALRYQPDAERTASVMRDLLLNVARPLNPAQIRQILTSAESDQRWYASLIQLLREESVTALEPRATLAKAALRYFENTPTKQVDTWTAPGTTQTPRLSQVQKARPRPKLSRRRLRTLANVFGLLAILLVAIAAVLFWQDVRQTHALVEDMQRISAGTYVIGDPTDREREREVTLNAFAIDYTEVTNRAYRRCYDAAACDWPSRVTSINRPDYFLDPTLGDYPMINVAWAEAATFCAWVGKRLPLAEEWEVAAGSALTLNERFLFPWGDVFDPQRVNSALSTAQDTLPTGTYSPFGDSPSGAADMAGNVAEWTATAADPEQDTPDAYVVKGGSFLSSAEELILSAQQTVDAESYAPWLGFRCAITLPQE
jgi:formylglycine-generating enzyme required for sulfatase activity